MSSRNRAAPPLDEDGEALRRPDQVNQTDHAARAGTSTWLPVDLAELIRGGLAKPVPSLLKREDGEFLLYPGKVHALNAEPESGKTWLALKLASEELGEGRRVVYIDYESDPEGIVERLRSLGVTDETTIDRFVYIRPSEGFDFSEYGDQQAELPPLLVAELDRGPSLVVLDGVAEVLALSGLDENSNTQATLFIRSVPKAIAERGPAVLLIDHVTKSREQAGRWARGASSKLGAVDVTLSLQVVSPFSRTVPGEVRVWCQKDRPGSMKWVRIKGVRLAGTMIVEPAGDRTSVRLLPPVEQGEFRPTVLMERVSRFLEGTGQASQNQVADGVSGKRTAKLEALGVLVSEGYVKRWSGPRSALLHESVKPYRAADDTPQDTPRDEDDDLGF